MGGAKRFVMVKTNRIETCVVVLRVYPTLSETTVRMGAWYGPPWGWVWGNVGMATGCARCGYDAGAVVGAAHSPSGTTCPTSSRLWVLGRVARGAPAVCTALRPAPAPNSRRRGAAARTGGERRTWGAEGTVGENTGADSGGLRLLKSRGCAWACSHSSPRRGYTRTQPRRHGTL